MSEEAWGAEDEGAPEEFTYISFSRISRYLHCPEQYRLYYVERLRPKVPAASLIFGQVIHMALSFHFRHGEDPVKPFEDFWNSAKTMALGYKKRESWEVLRTTGLALLEKFVREELPRITKVQASEQRFELAITGFALPLIGITDLVADLDQRSTVIDFKTAASAYETHEAALSDQLSAYQLAEPEAERTALCVLSEDQGTPDRVVRGGAEGGAAGRVSREGRVRGRRDRERAVLQAAGQVVCVV